MLTFTEDFHTGGYLVSEANGTRSREQVTILSGQNLKAGAVLGKQTVGTNAAAAALGANTGNGTFGAITVGAGAVVGAYVLRMLAATEFVVEDPAGVEIGHGATGAAFAGGGLGFTLTAGGTAFVAGDSFTLTVAAGSGKFAEYDPAAIDGTQVAAGILHAATDASLADAAGVITARDAEVNAAELVWKTGLNAGQQAAGLADLAGIGILAR